MSALPTSSVEDDVFTSTGVGYATSTDDCVGDEGNHAEANGVDLVCVRYTVADVDAFAEAAYRDLTPQDVSKALKKGISVNGRHSRLGFCALHRAVLRKYCELVRKLLEVGADANIQDFQGRTVAWYAAVWSTAEILQLVIHDKGVNINVADHERETPLIALVQESNGDAAARLKVLLAHPDLDLDATCGGKTAEQWAVHASHDSLAAMIAEERARRAADSC
jgi:hypothetical protein